MADRARRDRRLCHRYVSTQAALLRAAVDSRRVAARRVCAHRVPQVASDLLRQRYDSAHFDLSHRLMEEKKEKKNVVEICQKKKKRKSLMKCI